MSEVIALPSRQPHLSDTHGIQVRYREHIAHAAEDAKKPRYMPGAPFFVAVGVTLLGIVLAAIILL
jgi:hypothetical protein